MPSPLLFNVNTNDQPLPVATNSFIYADDLCLTTQQKTFEQVETTLASRLNELGAYYNENHLRPNPAKTQLTAFHLNNHQADRKMNVTWNGTKLDHTHSPVYPGITLDRSLTYRNHCLKISRKTLLQKQPPQEAAWYELRRMPPHHEDDDESTMSLCGGVLMSCLGPFHASQARRHNVK